MDKNRLARRSLLLIAAGTMLAGCSGRGIWPFGGRRRTRSAAAATPVSAQPVATVAGVPVLADGTALLPAVRMAAADRGRQGVILRAEGIAPTQGFHSPELRPVGRGADGIEVVELRARPPAAVEPVGPERARLLTVARFYTAREMREIRGFRVVGGQNAVTAATG